MSIEDMITEKANGKSYSEIGKLCGVSRQRIQQSLSPPLLLRERIIKKNNGKCELCGAYVGNHGSMHHKQYVYDLNAPDNLQYLCNVCHVRLHHPLNGLMTCTYCGKEFYAKDRASRLRRNISGNFFCSKQCQGKWVGRHYGWDAQRKAGTLRPRGDSPLPQLD